MNWPVVFDCEFENIVFLLVHCRLLIELSSNLIVCIVLSVFHGLVALTLWL